MIYITSDIHRDITVIENFTKYQKTSKSDYLIILGDAQINYYLDKTDFEIKTKLQSLPITLLFVHGNKEIRPTRLENYHEISIDGNQYFIEDNFPSLLFMKDGEKYVLENTTFLVLGGAYSIYCQGLKDGEFWWNDEQIDDQLMLEILHTSKLKNEHFDYILSHTCPINFIPHEVEFTNKMLDKKTEHFLQKIYDNFSFNKWYCGHFHISKKIEKLEIIFKNIIRL